MKSKFLKKCIVLTFLCRKQWQCCSNQFLNFYQNDLHIIIEKGWCMLTQSSINDHYFPGIPCALWTVLIVCTSCWWFSDACNMWYGECNDYELWYEIEKQPVWFLLYYSWLLRIDFAGVWISSVYVYVWCEWVLYTGLLFFARGLNWRISFSN